MSDLGPPRSITGLNGHSRDSFRTAILYECRVGHETSLRMPSITSSPRETQVNDSCATMATAET